MPDKAGAGRIARSVRPPASQIYVHGATKLALMVPRLAESRTRYAYFFAGIACGASGAIGAIECINWHHRPASSPHRRAAPSQRV